MIYDLKRDYGLEWLPATVQKCVKYAYLEKHKQWSHLPQFLDFTRVESEVVLVIKKLPISFRSLLSNRNLIESKCSVIIKHILTALQLLKDEDIVVRNISPMTVFFDTDLT